MAVKSYFNSNIGRLRFLGLLEGVSLLLLVGIAVPAKHLYGHPVLVEVIGPIHGVLFLLFVFNALSVGAEYQWKFKTTAWLILVASFVPFGTFYIDRKVLSKLKLPG